MDILIKRVLNISLGTCIGLVLLFLFNMFVHVEKGGDIQCGTGFFVNSEGYIVTAGHVLGNSRTATVLYKGIWIRSDVIDRSRLKDIGIVKITGYATPFLAFTKRYTKNMPIDIFGFPLMFEWGDNLKQARGISDYGYEPVVFRMAIKFIAHTYEGNSGGPIIAHTGVVGELTDGWTGIHHNPKDGSLSGFGTPSSTIEQELDKYDVVYHTTDDNTNVDFDILYGTLIETNAVVEVCT